MCRHRLTKFLFEVDLDKQEFEIEFDAKIRSTWNPYAFVQRGDAPPDWYQHVAANMYKLSDDAIRFIISPCDDSFFGGWMVTQAIYLTAFEDIVLRSDDGD